MISEKQESLVLKKDSGKIKIQFKEDSGFFR